MESGLVTDGARIHHSVHGGKTPRCYPRSALFTKIQAAADPADDYILDTNGNMKGVIALNIEYSGSKQRPEDIIVDGVDELYAIAKVEALVYVLSAAESGLLVEEPAFRLSLRDFTPISVSQWHTDFDQYISIPSRELCRFLPYAKAEQQQELLDLDLVDLFPPGKTKRCEF
ncbi:hypothetical protein N7517_007525 [Penicillium concentricum]|uniref:Uncharacterized protein n=1 Tax=Penicillium concentricum TaxID=293559 RepID=A0A9W9VCE0_9EURO|nr:uncharacterized protein N7517_007525 [Penicillium concentricum]KAJ5375519.1 hypothetical protein N7517_007525 [Penicillium concentricum]